MSLLETTGIDHVGIAVRGLEESIARYRALLGARVVHREVVEDQGVAVAFLELGDGASIELLAPLAEEGPLWRFLERRGEGLHHICLQVPDLEASLASLAAAGVALVDRVPRTGAGGARVAFVHPRALGGVMVELKEVAAGRPGERGS